MILEECSDVFIMGYILFVWKVGISCLQDLMMNIRESAMPQIINKNHMRCMFTLINICNKHFSLLNNNNK